MALAPRHRLNLSHCVRLAAPPHFWMAGDSARFRRNRPARWSAWNLGFGAGQGVSEKMASGAGRGGAAGHAARLEQTPRGPELGIPITGRRTAYHPSQSHIFASRSKLTR